jgi:cytochrome P450/deferrochelatase/peroxidase EfeB
VTTATPWTTRPPYFLTLGITADGLKALGVPQALRDRMPRVFIEGPADSGRAARNGDTGECDPTHWELGRPEQPVHLLVSLYADADVPASVAEFDRRRLQLQAALRPGGVEQVTCHATRALPDKKVHFGYRDSISQPRIAGVVPDTDADLQPRSSPGEFLLGADYVSIYGGSSLGLKPAQLCQNGTFAAVRVMDQDVEAFEQLLDQGAQKTGLDREWVAAKLMGRWRDGTPLSQAPLAAHDGTPPASGQGSDFNAFDYAPSAAHPDVPDDAQGRVCPVGSHIRRMNPRSGFSAGAPYSHRLIRRGMPYEVDGADGKTRRGLYGMFLCADLDRQFEFLLQEWANGDIAALGLRGTQDPMGGAQTKDATFRIAMEDGSTVTLENVPRLVKTRGSIYVLLPGLTALRTIARGFDAGDGGAAPGPVFVEFDDGTRMRFWPDAFDPKDPRFLANPYPFYAAFRKAAPVSLVKHGDYRSWWVFSHELVTEVCEDESLFLKEPPDSRKDDRGLFFMDPPRHEQVRRMMDPMFARAIEGADDVAREQADAAIRDILRGGATFDLIPSYSNRVTRNVFMKMFGVPEWQWSFLGAQVDLILKHFDQMLPTLERAPAAAASTVVMGIFLAGQAFCPHAASPELYCQLVQAKRQGQLAESELVKTALHFALGGYLSTDFLVGTAIHNLLSRPGALGEYLHAGDAGRTAALEELMRFDAPFQLADRFAAQDTVLAGRQLRRGDRVSVVYGAANHDEAVFAQGDDLQIARTIRPGANYVFGHGIHRCIGAPLAPKVARIAIDTLLARLPQLALAHGVPQRYQDPYYRGFSSLLLLHR